MNIFAKIALFLGVLMLFNSCKKEEITTHENLIIEGNTPPPYSGISETKIEIYVSKLHIDLLGEQATTTEINNEVAYLKSNELRMGARDTLINQIMAKDGNLNCDLQVNWLHGAPAQNVEVKIEKQVLIWVINYTNYFDYFFNFEGSYGIKKSGMAIQKRYDGNDNCCEYYVDYIWIYFGIF